LPSFQKDFLQNLCRGYSNQSVLSAIESLEHSINLALSYYKKQPCSIGISAVTPSYQFYKKTDENETKILNKEFIVSLYPNIYNDVWEKFTAFQYHFDDNEAIAFALITDYDIDNNPLNDKWIISQIQSDVCAKILNIYEILDPKNKMPINLTHEDMGLVEFINCIKSTNIARRRSDLPFDINSSVDEIKYTILDAILKIEDFLSKFNNINITANISRLFGNNFICDFLKEMKDIFNGAHLINYEKMKEKAIKKLESLPIQYGFKINFSTDNLINENNMTAMFVFLELKKCIMNAAFYIREKLNELQQKFQSKELILDFLKLPREEQHKIYHNQNITVINNEIKNNSHANLAMYGITEEEFLDFYKNPEIQFILNNWQDILLRKISMLARQHKVKSILMEDLPSLRNRIQFLNPKKVTGLYGKLQKDYNFIPYEGTEFNRGMVSREAQTNGWFSFAKKENL
jgi:hypothetical protein